MVKYINKNCSQEGWIWMPHPGHFCAASACRFVLNTYVPTGFIISTIGEYYPDELTRRLNLEDKINLNFTDIIEKDEVDIRKLYKSILELQGDDFNNAYSKYIGFEDIGDKHYETIVFLARENKDPNHQCCPYLSNLGIDNYEFEIKEYNDAESAKKGHYQLCYKWSE